jgi:hypothetical protein
MRFNIQAFNNQDYEYAVAVHLSRGGSCSSWCLGAQELIWPGDTAMNETFVLLR